MVMLLNQYLFGGIVASILGFLLLSQFFRRGKKNKVNNEEKMAGEVVEMTSSRDGDCGSRDGPDVVVVGAGVAGSALAYALGK
ncbi:uncharacterized protein A4U43_C03F23490, partial [Asparagus officinalis]